MKKLNTYSRLFTALSIVIGITLAIGYSYYTKAMAKEQITTSVSINSNSVSLLTPIIFDVADEGVAKKLLQPTHLIARYQIKNEGQESLTIKVAAVNFTCPVIVDTGAPGLEKPTAAYVTTLAPGKSIRFKIRVDLPSTPLNATKFSLGTLRIMNQQTDLPVGIVPVYAMDSTVEAPLEKTSATPKPESPHEDHQQNK